MARKFSPDKTRRRALLGVAAACVPAAACLATLVWFGGGASIPTLARLIEIERARRQLLAHASWFRHTAGEQSRDTVLNRVRRACEERRVVRLDDIEERRSREHAPQSETGVARDSPGAESAPLLDLDFVRDGTGAMVAAERRRMLDADAHALALGDEQVHTRETLNLRRDEIGTIEVEARSTGSAFLLLGWSDSDAVARMHRDKVRIDLRGDGRVHLYSIDATKALERGLTGDAVLRRLFLSARSEDDAVVEVTHLRLLARKQRYSGAQSGVTYEEVAGQLRRSLWQRTPGSVAYDVVVAAQPSLLETAVAMVGRDEPVEVELAVESGSQSATLLKKLIEPGTWEDVSLDLGAWSGRAVTLRLSTRGLAGAIALWSSPTLRPVRDTSGAPPIMLVLEDALRADRLSVYGGPVAAPAHQRLAAAGTAFERAFSQATQTRSSVPSLMTSLPPSATGTWDFSDSLRDEYVTLAEMLRACGYATASFLQNGNAGAYAGLHQGFDVVFDEKVNGVRAADVLGGKLREWIDDRHEQPFFAYIHILDPHGPFDPAPRPALPPAETGTAVKFDRALDPPWLASPTAEIRRVLYDGEVAANDAALDDFWNWLDRRGLLARSVIALLADHGEYLGDGGLWRHHPPSRLEVARVPLLLAAPGLPAGRRESANVGLIDVAPTLLDLAGIEVSGTAMFGRSLAPMLQGHARPPARALFVEEPGLERGERSAKECGSLLLSDAQLLLPCIGESAFLPSPTSAAAAPDGPATSVEALRVIGLGPRDYGEELAIGDIAAALLDWRTRTLLRDLQRVDIEGWQRMTGGSSAAIRTEPQTSERLRGLGYVE
ncbi:MAG: sulfatase [Deltaproteobacteria bacterium]|nr:sulfatase [Deltaproteobacteria bacterium]